MRALNLDSAYDGRRKPEISGEELLRRGIQISSDASLTDERSRSQRADRINNIIGGIIKSREKGTN